MSSQSTIMNKFKGVQLLSAFFRRGVKFKLPNSIIRKLGHRALIKQRHDRQIRIAQEKGRTSKDQFQLQDKVIVQDMNSKRWIHHGEVTDLRHADDDSIQSYEITKIQVADEGEHAGDTGPPLRRSRAN